MSHSVQLPRQAPEGAEAVVYKDEGHSGPIWFRLADGRRVNVADSPHVRFKDAAPRPQWVTGDQARRYAKAIGLPLEEV